MPPGIDNLNQAEAWRNSQPNLLLHQRMVYTTPEDYAQEVISLGGQLVLPIHHETAFAFNADMQKFTEEVNGLLAARSAACPDVQPQTDEVVHRADRDLRGRRGAVSSPKTQRKKAGAMLPPFSKIIFLGYA